MGLSRRAQSIPGSVVFAIDAKVQQLLAEGVDVIGLGAGQPDFPSPRSAIEAAQRFVEAGNIGYTATPGIPKLRAAAAALMSRVCGLEFDASQVVVTNGAKEALALAIAAVADPGDELLLPTPAWISYGPMAQMVDVVPVSVTTDVEHGFKLTPSDLASAITPRSRVLVINSPGNPTGAVYTRDELAALAEVIVEHDLWILSDEIYWPFVFDGEFVSPASLPELAARTIVVNGLSKSHSMTGWRVGFLAAPREIATGVSSLKSHFSSNTSSPAQYAALGALEGGDEHTRAMAEAFARRRRTTIDALRAMPGVELQAPAGAFYAFPRVDSCYGGDIRGSVDFCSALLDEVQLAAVPGAAFGEDRCIRLSIATADEVLAEGLARLGRFVSRRQAAPNTSSATTARAERASEA